MLRLLAVTVFAHLFLISPSYAFSRQCFDLFKTEFTYLQFTPLKDPKWLQLEEKIHQTMEQNAAKHYSRIVVAITKKEPFAEFMTAAGMRLENSQVRLPTLSQIVKHYYDLINSAIERGEITIDDVIIPGLLFEGSVKGEAVNKIIKFGEPFPDDFKPSRFPSQWIFTDMLSKGVFPLVDVDQETVVDDWSAASHDIFGHLVGLATYPGEYMKPLKKSMAILNESLKQKSEEDISRRLFRKLFFAHENIFFTPMNKIPWIKENMLVPEGYFNNPLLSVNEMTVYLSRFDLSTLQTRLKLFSDNYSDLIVTPGGVGTDVIARSYWVQGRWNRSWNYDELMFHKIESNVMSISRATPEEWHLSSDEIKGIVVNQLAQLQTLLGLSIRYNATDWFDTIFTLRFNTMFGYLVNNQSPLVRDVEGSGLFRRDGNMLNGILFHD